MKLGAIEGGGTKFICGIGSADGHLLDSISIPTTTPEQTLGHVMQYFAQFDVQSIGFGSFGPVGTDPNKSNYGQMLNTPKPHWAGFPMLSYLKTQLQMPIVVDTDVNMAALGEATWGAAVGLDSCLYMTVGTGIGAGAIMKGRIVHGFAHTEMGHLLIRKHREDTFNGNCPFHTDCLEGLAAGPAIEARSGRKGALLDREDQLWELEAYYLAQALVNIALVLMPKKVIMGGGVMNQTQLFPYIREQVKHLMQDYLELPEDWIVPPGLGKFSALKGALVQARMNV
ncbi:ROK family protein [Paenibacillus mendelii]|uniref:fructokinase n=1 Tax=Paenibacillus mendelii TaxID=206163 RepID=A0ABV6JNY2_9BACL|nr:ROK family protein [Paenibacillus mendelii]MCQ6559184.1 ROK family protein [Paenibacillus mendelii]